MKIALLIPSPIHCGGFVSFTNHLMRSFYAEGIKANLFVMTKSGKPTKATIEHHNPVIVSRKNKDDIVKTINLLNKNYDATIIPYLYMSSGRISQSENYVPLIDLSQTIIKCLKNPILVIHDSAEKKKIDLLFKEGLKTKIIFIGEKDLKFYEYLEQKSFFIKHPYCKLSSKENYSKENKILSTSRIDWDKHYEICIEASKMIDYQWDIFTSYKNAIYIFHELRSKYGWDEENYRGGFKNSELPKLYSKYKVLWDMSAISGGGGRTQYTMLEAFEFGLVPILNSKWYTKNSPIKDGKNAFYVENAKQLAQKTQEILQNANLYQSIVENNKRFLSEHSPKKIISEYKKQII